MIGSLTAFAAELRMIGIPVSMVEVIDAGRAVEYADLESPSGLRAALRATMIKSHRHVDAFDRAFDVFFLFGGEQGDSDQPGHGADETYPGSMAAMVADALERGDHERLVALVRDAVERFGRTGVGTAGAGTYYAYRVLRRIGVEEVRTLLVGDGGGDPLSRRIAADRVERLMRELRETVRREVLRRRVVERGVAATARSVREPLLEDLDLQHATRAEIDAIKAIVAPLSRKLATRLSMRRRHGDRGRLDVRRTIRRSLPHGGVLVDPQFKTPRVRKPRIVLLCDTSGSMATFSRFAMQLTHAIASQLSGVRSFVFVEGIAEVTEHLGPDAGFEDSLAHIATAADVFRGTGHSDYGRSFVEFVERHPDAVTPGTTVILTGDGRSNYRPTEVDAFRSMSDRARAVFWLNPEPERFWDTGDSAIGDYAPWCDRVDEVRTLRHLERFIEAAALPHTGGGRRRPVDETLLPGAISR